MTAKPPQLGPPFARGSHHRNITVTINGEEDFEGVTFENCNFESAAPPGERAVRFSDCTLTQCHFDELTAVEMQSESNMPRTVSLTLWHAMTTRW